MTPRSKLMQTPFHVMAGHKYDRYEISRISSTTFNLKETLPDTPPSGRAGTGVLGLSNPLHQRAKNDLCADPAPEDRKSLALNPKAPNPKTRNP